MAQTSRQVQTQTQQQVQTLSPQQIQVVRLLELPAVELEDRVRAELLENPALEEGREEPAADDYADTPDTDKESPEDGGDTGYDSLSDYLTEDDIPDYKLQENNRSRDDRAEEIPFSDATSFSDRWTTTACCANPWTASPTNWPSIRASKPPRRNWKRC